MDDRPAATDQPPPGRLPNRSFFRRPAVTLAVLAAALLLGLVLWAANRTSIPPEFLRALESGEPALIALAYSPDGRRLLATSGTGNVVVWGPGSTGSRTLSTQAAEPVLAACFSHFDELIAGSGKTLCVWPLGRMQGTASPQKLPGFPAPITAVAVRPRQRELAVGLSNGAVYVLRKGGRPHVDLVHAGGVKRLVYAPDGGVLVSSGTDGRLVWRNAETLAVLARSDAHSAEVAGLAFSPDGRRLASGDWNGEIKVWDADRRQLQRELAQSDAVCALGFTGQAIVTGSWDGRIRIISAADGQTLDNFDTGRVIADLAVHPEGDMAATVSTGGTVRLWRWTRL